MKLPILLLLTFEDKELRHSAARWWLVLTLLFGLFSAAGFEVSQSGQKHITKTEQVVSTREAARRISSFKWIASSSPNIIASGVSPDQLNVAALVYSKRILVKERCAVKRATSINNLIHDFKPVFIPRSSCEHHINSLAG